MFGANMNGCKKKKTCNPKKKRRRKRERTLIKVHFESVSEIYFLLVFVHFVILYLLLRTHIKHPFHSRSCSPSQIEWICKIVRRKHWEGNEMRRKNERNNPHRQGNIHSSSTQFIFSCNETSFFQSSSSSCLVLRLASREQFIRFVSRFEFF